MMFVSSATSLPVSSAELMLVPVDDRWERRRDAAREYTSENAAERSRTAPMASVRATSALRPADATSCSDTLTETVWDARPSFRSLLTATRPAPSCVNQSALAAWPRVTNGLEVVGEI